MRKPGVNRFPFTRATPGENRNATEVVVTVFDLVEHLVGQSICELLIPVWVLVLAGALHRVGHGARVVVTITQEFSNKSSSSPQVHEFRKKLYSRDALCKY